MCMEPACYDIETRFFMQQPHTVSMCQFYWAHDLVGLVPALDGLPTRWRTMVGPGWPGSSMSILRSHPGNDFSCALRPGSSIMQKYLIFQMACTCRPNSGVVYVRAVNHDGLSTHRSVRGQTACFSQMGPEKASSYISILMFLRLIVTRSTSSCRRLDIWTPKTDRMLFSVPLASSFTLCLILLLRDSVPHQSRFTSIFWWPRNFLRLISKMEHSLQWCN